MNRIKTIQQNKIWRKTTEGEALYRWLFKGARALLRAPFLFLKGYLTPLKIGERLPSGSHYPIVRKYKSKVNYEINIYVIGITQYNTSQKYNIIETKERWYHFISLGGTIYLW